MFLYFTNAIRDNPQIAVKRYPLFHYRSRRLHMIILLSISSFCTNFMMSGIDMTMTCMINSTAVDILEHEHNHDGLSLSYFAANNPNSSGKCVNRDDPNVPKDNDYGGTLVWTHKEQNMVFAGAFWGGCFSVISAMFVLQSFSVKYVYLGALVTYTLANLFIPIAAEDSGYQLTFVLRFLLGLGDGFVTPSVNSLISNWFPVSERSTALALNAIGEQVAGVGESPLAATFCESSIGWPAVFYLGSLISAIWCVLWYFTASASPETCKTITIEEKKYLKYTNESAIQRSTTWRDVPYRKIFTSIPFLAQLQCHFLMCFSAALMGTYLPTYFKEVLLLGVMANGLFVSLPNFFNLAAKVIWGMAFDKLKELKHITPTTSAKFSQAVSSYGMSLSFLGLAFLVDCSTPALALVFSCILYSCQGIETSGFVTSLLSLAPQYTATLSSISLFCAQLGIVVTPYVMTALHNTGNGGWTAMFLTASGACALSGTIFILFGSGDVQQWAINEENSTLSSEEEANA